MEFSSQRFLREIKGLDAQSMDLELLNEVRQLVQRKLVKQEVYDNLLNIHFKGEANAVAASKGPNPGESVLDKLLAILTCRFGIDDEEFDSPASDLGADYTEWEKPVMEGKLVFYNEKERRARFQRADAVLYERRIVFFEFQAEEPDAEDDDDDDDAGGMKDMMSDAPAKQRTDKPVAGPRKILATVELTEDSYVGDSNLKVFQDAGGNATGFVVGKFEEQIHLAADSKEVRSFWMHTIARTIRKLQDTAGFFDTPLLMGQVKQTKQAKKAAFERRLEAYKKGVEDPQLIKLGVDKATVAENLRPHTGKYRKPVLRSSIIEEDELNKSLREGAPEKPKASGSGKSKVEDINPAHRDRPASARVARHPNSAKHRETKSATVRVVVRRPVDGPNGVDENGHIVYDEHDEYHTLTITTEEMEPAPQDVVVVADVNKPTVSVVTDIGKAFNAYASDVAAAKEAALSPDDSDDSEDEVDGNGETRSERRKRLAREEAEREAEWNRLANAGHTPPARPNPNRKVPSGMRASRPGRERKMVAGSEKTMLGSTAPIGKERGGAKQQRHLHQKKNLFDDDSTRAPALKSAASGKSSPHGSSKKRLEAKPSAARRKQQQEKGGKKSSSKGKDRGSKKQRGKQGSKKKNASRKSKKKSGKHIPANGTSIRIPVDKLGAKMAEVQAEVQAEWVANEIDLLVKTIARIGKVDPEQGGIATATFKQLSDEYNRAQSSVLVGVLLRAKRKGVVMYTGDMLFRGHDDNVKITVKEMAKDFMIV